MKKRNVRWTAKAVATVLASSMAIGTAVNCSDVLIVEAASSEAEENISAFIERMYTKAMDRTSDVNGKKYWMEQVLSQKSDAASMARDFLIAAPEMKNRNLNNDDYVEVLYQTFFDRASDTNGKNYWVGELNGGKSRESVVAGFVNSKEFGQICVKYGVSQGYMNEDGTVANPGIGLFVYRLYDTLLGRKPDAEGIMYWVKQIVTGQKTIEEVATEEFIFSNEFKKLSAGMSDKQFVDTMYATFFGRTADNAGQTYWRIQLGSGATRDQVVFGFSDSNEFRKLLSDYNLSTDLKNKYTPVKETITEDDLEENNSLWESSITGWAYNPDDKANPKQSPASFTNKGISSKVDGDKTVLTFNYDVETQIYSESYIDPSITDSDDRYKVLEMLNCSFSDCFYDASTGTLIEEGTTVVKNDNGEFSVTLKEDSKWEQGVWLYSDDGHSGSCPMYCRGTVTISIPSNYDGLMFGVGGGFHTEDASEYTKAANLGKSSTEKGYDIYTMKVSQCESAGQSRYDKYLRQVDKWNKNKDAYLAKFEEDYLVPNGYSLATNAEVYERDFGYTIYDVDNWDSPIGFVLYQAGTPKYVFLDGTYRPWWCECCVNDFTFYTLEYYDYGWRDGDTYVFHNKEIDGISYPEYRLISRGELDKWEESHPGIAGL